MFPSTEAQVANISDDIAYLTHDFDDGLRENLFNLNDLNFKVTWINNKKIRKRIS